MDCSLQAQPFGENLKKGIRVNSFFFQIKKKSGFFLFLVPYTDHASFYSPLKRKQIIRGIYNSIQMACEITLLLHQRGVEHTQSDSRGK